TRFLADRIRGIDTGHIHGDPVHYPDRYETARIEHAIVLYPGLQRRAQPIVRLRPGSACETPDGKTPAARRTASAALSAGPRWVSSRCPAPPFAAAAPVCSGVRWTASPSASAARSASHSSTEAP